MAGSRCRAHRWGMRARTTTARRRRRQEHGLVDGMPSTRANIATIGTTTTNCPHHRRRRPALLSMHHAHRGGELDEAQKSREGMATRLAPAAEPCSPSAFWRPPWLRLPSLRWLSQGSHMSGSRGLRVDRRAWPSGPRHRRILRLRRILRSHAHIRHQHPLQASTHRPHLPRPRRHRLCRDRHRLRLASNNHRHHRRSTFRLICLLHVLSR